MAKNTVKAIAMVTFDAATLTTAYQPLNPAGLDFSCFYIKIINLSDRDLTLSYDRVTNNDFIEGDTDLEINFQQNALPNGMVALMAKGTIIYVKSTPGGTGNIHLVGYYTPQGI